MDEIIGEFDLDGSTLDASLPLNWNIAPTNEIYIIRDTPDKRLLDSASWGIIAPWQKNFAEARASQSHAINARSESIHEKPTFRDAFKQRRCLVPAQGYYEWATALGQYRPKQPFYISARDGLQLPIAGIWSSWRAPNGEVIETASIITQEAQGELETIHSRMPVFMPPDRWDLWLNPRNTDVNELKSLMVVAQPESIVIARPVSDAVNSVANNGKELTVETPLGEPETLF